MTTADPDNNTNNPPVGNTPADTGKTGTPQGKPQSAQQAPDSRSNTGGNPGSATGSDIGSNTGNDNAADSAAPQAPPAGQDSGSPDEFKERHIRSFVHRRSHMTPGQKQAVEQHMDKWALPYQASRLDYDQAFGRNAPTILEIGFGMGETTQKIAQLRADENFLGVEVFNAGVGALLKRIEESGVGNIRIVQHDAVEVVQNMIAPDSLAGVHIYFPDPWPKKRHHKRRLVRPEFIALLASRIKPGGYIHCATDWEDYAVQMLDVLSGEPLLQNTSADYSPKPEYRPQTKFETRGLRLGHGIRDLVFKRI